MRSRFATLAIAAAVSGSALAAPLGNAFTYQGRLVNNGQAVNGTADVRFRLWDALQNGAPVSPTFELSGVNAVNVAGGLFTAEVGFDPTEYDGSDVFLEIAVRSPAGVGGYVTLTPRQRLAATPYALQTRGMFVDQFLNVGLGTLEPNGRLHVVGDHVITGGGQIRMFHQSNSVNSSVLIDGDYFNGSLISLRQADGTPRIDQRGDLGQITLNEPTNGLVRLNLEAGGTTADGGRLSVRNGANIVSLLIDGDPDTGGDGGLIQAREGAGSNLTTIEISGAESRVSGYENNVEVATLSANSFGGRVTLLDPNGTSAAVLSATSTSGGFLQVNRAGTASSGVFIDGDSSGSGLMTMTNSTGAATVTIDADGGGGAGELVLRDGAATAFLMDSEAKAMTFHDGTQETVRISANGAGGGGGMNLFNSLGSATVEIDADDENDHAAIRLFREGAASSTISLLTAETNTQGATLIMRNAAGTATIELDADFNGVGRVIADEVQVNGADLSENFDIASAAGVEVEPGMVVSLDPANPGKLLLSSKSFDRTVAGIVSGAGGIKPGMFMGQKGTVADGKHPVALTGRVYCYVDASNGAVQVGDLLTTSDTPGHAMKVADPAKAAGAIIGKAMTNLESGRGLVLVLVSLQ